MISPARRESAPPAAHVSAFRSSRSQTLRPFRTPAQQNSSPRPIQHPHRSRLPSRSRRLKSPPRHRLPRSLVPTLHSLLVASLGSPPLASPLPRSSRSMPTLQFHCRGPFRWLRRHQASEAGFLTAVRMQTVLTRCRRHRAPGEGHDDGDASAYENGLQLGVARVMEPA